MPEEVVGRNGVVITDWLLKSCILSAAPIIQRFFPATTEILMPGGRVPEVGEVFRQQDLARTLRAIAEEGVDTFYNGWLARAVVDQIRSKRGHPDHGGHGACLEHRQPRGCAGDSLSRPPVLHAGSGVLRGDDGLADSQTAGAVRSFGPGTCPPRLPPPCHRGVQGGVAG
ncbi:MAG: gamma-glutamyltransferase [Chloroflexi bacterium]|nr:gamma-glutamyltransferase [Chloroflexota bacterium]